MTADVGNKNTFITKRLGAGRCQKVNMSTEGNKVTLQIKSDIRENCEIKGSLLV